MQTILLLKSAFLCVFRFFGLSSFDTVTTLILSRLASFHPFFEVIPEIFRKFVTSVFIQHCIEKVGLINETFFMRKNKDAMGGHFDLGNFIRDHFASLCAIAFKITGNSEVAKDLAQDVIIKFWENQGQHKQLDSIEN